ncbi:CBS domain-containing protein [Massilia sp. DWR3-1-1]|uniref:CBS domain-containing protein n=1 Tax=Massilia sp. DWR3-1-1 TaxID=2804559 RepID=UPI003CECC019
MRIGEICTTSTIFCTRDDSVQDAAMKMRQHHVGDLVVIDQPDDDKLPVGILTDRDIVVSVIALGLDPASLLVGDIMSDDLDTCHADDDVYETIERMHRRGVRRLPVVDGSGRLSGIVSADDLLGFLAEEMSELARIAPHQQAQERRARH